MSVLIRGMDKIPEDGATLIVKHDDNGKVYIKYAGVMGYSMELERIPEKHGDLIDRDALRPEELENFGGWQEPLWGYTEKCIREALTIIEAEGVSE